jgi:ATP-binding cassette subfamily B protein/subfamily B ATP-binding cassette protein MsbA
MFTEQIKVIRSLFFKKNGENYWIFCFLLIPNLIASLLEGLSFGLILSAFKILMGESGHLLHMFSRFPLTSWVASLSNHQVFIFFIILAIVAQILRSVLFYIGQIGVLSFSLKIQTLMLQDVYHQILKFSFPFVNQYKMGDLLEYTKTPSQVISFVMDRLNRSIVSFFAIIVLVGILFFISVPLTMLALIVFGGLFFSQKIIFAKISSISEHLSKDAAHFTRHIAQSLHGLRIIHTFARQSYMLNKIYATIQKIKETSKSLHLWNQAIIPINETIGISLVGLFLVLGYFFIDARSNEAIAMLLTFIVIIYRLNTRMQTLFISIGEIAFHWGSIVRLEEILSVNHKEFSDQKGKELLDFKEAITFQEVALTYPGTLRPALQDLSFKIEKGKMTALVGMSGAGKSSIIDLILRLYKPTQGVIRVDDVDLEALKLDDWRSCLGVVSQDIFIFPETIEENIRFGKPDASFDEVIHAAKLAGADSFIAHLPEQYRTELGEKGYRLSGGEKQKIALARALIRNPEILILDEASSSLDTHSELVIQHALNSLKGEKTIIAIAHRLSTIKNADTIFVIEDGKIMEQGSHGNLIEKKGRYASFWSLQSAGLD